MAASSWNPDTAVAPDAAIAIDAGSVGELSAEDREHLRRFEKLRVILDEEPFRVEFFQAVRLLERMEKSAKPVGYFVPPESEAIRFASHASLSFPPSQLYSLDREPNGQLRLVVQFMGLCASITIMPNVYTEYLLSQLRNKDVAMRDFFDMFNHRLISLFYRGWEKYRFFVGFEAGRVDGLTPRMMDLLGLGTRGTASRSAIPDQAFLAYAGLLGRHVKSSASLKQILEDYFDVPVTIVQFAGTWRSLPPENRTTFGGSNRSSLRLGQGAVVGDEVWEHHGRIRIRIGPVDYDDYVSFLPGPGAYRDLEAWVKFFSSGQFEAEVQLILKREGVPSCELGLQGRDEPRLGLVSWLKTKPLQTDPGDAIFLLR